MYPAMGLGSIFRRVLACVSGVNGSTVSRAEENVIEAQGNAGTWKTLYPKCSSGLFDHGNCFERNIYLGHQDLLRYLREFSLILFFIRILTADVLIFWKLTWSYTDNAESAIEVPSPFSVMFHLPQREKKPPSLRCLNLLNSPLRQEKIAQSSHSKNILVLLKVMCSNMGPNQQTLK